MSIEQDRIAFELTVKRVARFNKKAARALRRIAEHKEGNFAYDKSLSACFIWDETKEGHVYWSDIHYKLGEMYRLYR